MADQGIWFKLWVSSVDDGNLDNLDIADFGRWAKLGAYTKRHGTEGKIVISPPSRTLCSMLQVGGFDSLVEAILRLESCGIKVEFSTVTGVTNATVTFHNWLKYQGDNSLHRVRQFRQRVTVKKRREEKRREEKRLKPPYKSPRWGDDINFIFQFWKWAMEHPKAKLDNKRAAIIRSRLKEGYSVSELIHAVWGCSGSPHHMGKNEEGKIYDSIGLIFRNADKIDQFRSYCKEEEIGKAIRRFQQETGIGDAVGKNGRTEGGDLFPAPTDDSPPAEG